MSEQSVSDLLYVGPIYVDVGYDFDVPTAETVDMLGAMELGGKIRVDLVRYEFGDEYLYEDDPPLGSVEMWKMLLTQMRDLLARCFVFGQMKMMELSMRVDTEEEEKNLDTAIVELGDDRFLIPVTPRHARAALTAREEESERVQQGLENLLGFMQAQKTHEGEDITLGEAVKRQEKGTEDIKRIVEGEDGTDKHGTEQEGE